MAPKKAAKKSGKTMGHLLRMTQSRRTKLKSDYKPRTVFVIMAFGNTAKAYSVIRDECQSQRLTVRRADENAGSGLIIQEIYDSISDAEFIICDLTKGRPNVYYELGYAHGLGNSENVLLLAKAGTELSFDIAAYRVNRYRSLEELRSIVLSAVAKWKKAPHAPRYAPKRKVPKKR